MMLVTGGAGFIGSAVVRSLQSRGHDVRIVDNLSKRRDVTVPEGVDYVEGDVADRETCARVFHDVEVCFHLAAGRHP